MHKQLDELLCQRYPAIFSDDDSNALPAFGFECTDGWFPLIEAACALIQRHIDLTGAEQVVAVQIKEKFGGLRFYHRQDDDYAMAVVGLVERLSVHMCEICGTQGKGISLLGWMQTRCSEHAGSPVYDEPLMARVRENLMLAPRMGGVLGAALGLFALNDQAAARWLTQPVLALGNAVPLELAGSLEGQRQVMMLIGRIEDGITS